MKLLKYFIIILCCIIFCECSYDMREMTASTNKSQISKNDFISLLTGDSTKLWVCPKLHLAESYSRKGFLYKSYLINEDGTLMRYATPQEQIDTTIFDVCNMNILILLKGRNGKRIFWRKDSIEYISQDTLKMFNPFREILYINSKKCKHIEAEWR